MFDSDKTDNLNDEVSANCQICGGECSEQELNVISSPLKLSGDATMSVCGACLQSTAEDSFKDAADILAEIGIIVRATAGNPERRLLAIKNILEQIH